MRKPSMMLPSCTKGMEATTVPLAPVRRGAVKISSVGILATKGWPAEVQSSPASQM